ncbi:MAG: APC family permease [Clostridia bacterium]|nr:APC family permease [Clostridia bacterium]
MTNKTDNLSIPKNGIKEGESFKRTLTCSMMVLYGVAFMVITSWVTSFGAASVATYGMVALAYSIATVAMILSAYSYSQMSKEYPVAGSAYSYANKTMKPQVGFLVGWALIMDYVLLPMLCVVASATILTSVWSEVPASVWAIGIIVILLVVCLMGLVVTIGTNLVIVAIQVIAMIVMAVMIFRFLGNGGGAGTLFHLDSFINRAAFEDPDFSVIGLMTGTAILCVNFLGFDAISTLAEEAKNPRKDVGKAMVLTCIIAGASFTFYSYIIQLCWPDSLEGAKNSDVMFAEIMDFVNPMISNVMCIIYVIGAIACTINSTTSGARIIFAMGRDGLLPKPFAHLTPKRRVPSVAVIAISAVACVGIFIDLSMAFSLVSYGALLGFISVNISVIILYYVKKKERGAKAILKWLIIPICGAVICLLIWLSLAFMAKIVGTIWMIIGLIYLAIQTKGFKKLPPELDLDQQI